MEKKLQQEQQNIPGQTPEQNQSKYERGLQATLETMPPTYRRAYKKAVIITEQSRIKMSDFSYADAARDTMMVNDKLNRIANSDNPEGNYEAIIQAKILEAMLFDAAKNFNWFGVNTTGVMPSIYDDLFNGNDLILEHSHGDFKSHSGIGVDITIGDTSFLKKVENTKERLRRGELGQVKYFQSPDGSFTGQLRNIPHLVIGISRDDLFRTTELWLNGKSSEIEKSSTQLWLLKLMIAECDEMGKSTSHDQVKLVYQKEKRILEDVLRERQAFVSSKN